MTQEELQNWIVCGALYWKTTGDNAWLDKNKDVFKQALESMQVRDDLDPAKRDGITTYVSNVGARIGRNHHLRRHGRVPAASREQPLYRGEIIRLLHDAAASLLQLGEAGLGRGRLRMPRLTPPRESFRIGMTAHQFFPALLNGKSKSSIIPAIEGLAYPYAMGLKRTSRWTGPTRT